VCENAGSHTHDNNDTQLSEKTFYFNITVRVNVNEENKLKISNASTYSIIIDYKNTLETSLT
jgi:hypothetical protein